MSDPESGTSVIEDDAKLASVTQIPTEFNAQPASEPETPAPEHPLLDKFKAAFISYNAEMNEVIKQKGLKVLRGLGEVGIRLVTTLKSPDLSIEQKAGGVLAAGVGAAGEIVKGALDMSPGIITLIPGETARKVEDTVTAFKDGFVDQATGLIAKEKPDGTYSFDASGISKFTSKKGLIKVGIESAVGGVDAAMASVHERTKDSPSGASKAFEGLHDVYDSRTGRIITRLVARKAVNHLHGRVDAASKAA